jgi:hypothetical protein
LLGKHLGRGGVLDLLAAAMLARSPRLAKTQPVKILAALDAQTLVVPGTAEFGRVIAGVAAQLRDVSTERAALAEDLEARLEAHPLAEVLTSMPGVGLRTAIKILTIVGDGSAFPTAGHLAAYAGLAPVTRSSGPSIKGETRSQRGHHALKSALFLSAFASLGDPASRAYYDRKLAEKKRHNAALICLARDASTSCSPCSATASPTTSPPPTNHSPKPKRLDSRHRDTPQDAHKQLGPGDPARRWKIHPADQRRQVPAPQATRHPHCATSATGQRHHSREIR